MLIICNIKLHTVEELDFVRYGKYRLVISVNKAYSSIKVYPDSFIITMLIISHQNV